LSIINRASALTEKMLSQGDVAVSASDMQIFRWGGVDLAERHVQ
jgi:hypothetical protein